MQNGTPVSISNSIPCTSRAIALTNQCPSRHLGLMEETPFSRFIPITLFLNISPRLLSLGHLTTIGKSPQNCFPLSSSFIYDYDAVSLSSFDFIENSTNHFTSSLSAMSAAVSSLSFASKKP